MKLLRLQTTWARGRRTELFFFLVLLEGRCWWLNTCCPHENGISHFSTSACMPGPAEKKKINKGMILSWGHFSHSDCMKDFSGGLLQCLFYTASGKKKKICCMTQSHPASSQRLLFLPLRFCIQHPYSNNSISSLPFFTFISS